MKTIKELEAEQDKLRLKNTPITFSILEGRRLALKDVLGLIDEVEEVCINATEPGWSKAKIFEELKARTFGLQLN